MLITDPTLIERYNDETPPSVRTLISAWNRNAPQDTSSEATKNQRVHELQAMIQNHPRKTRNNWLAWKTMTQQNLSLALKDQPSKTPNQSNQIPNGLGLNHMR